MVFTVFVKRKENKSWTLRPLSFGHKLDTEDTATLDTIWTQNLK